VVKTGTVNPKKGTVVHVNNAYNVGTANPWPEVHMNERGQILTQVIYGHRCELRHHCNAELISDAREPS
jgi:hypothetical protein